MDVSQQAHEPNTQQVVKKARDKLKGNILWMKQDGTDGLGKIGEHTRAERGELDVALAGSCRRRTRPGSDEPSQLISFNQT